MRGITIRPTTEDDWEAIRALRLEMIRDTPMAYAEHLHDAEQLDEAEWRARGRRGQDAGGTSVVAIDADGRWVGAMGAFVPDEATGPLLVGVYVAPSHRGRGAGVADRLLDAIDSWAAERGPTLRLHVHERNERAQAFYARRGFRPTGATEPYVLAPEERELEMIRDLGGVSS
ncbi:MULTISPECIES: GNAT family N-acetyltransferase [unclassified Curtobacterium]|uniref:GNAT family N-acetyltransferase n=1 Tax=unclassified Curtobacterium TaxID=257496 RepID=UPI0008DEA02A|nr:MULTISPECIES: GNAT family N-acetyltransferase [unclassified Curtobacterium]OIH96359.1 GNAT family N-acetyltransferase [Curtobacterium sp. MCBA15_003]OII13633.1 GNAT family N-acetyltransferase [Curtobacterium sp. MCBA15_009]OII32696.1 GNAT family N-acetyltransferase [Curtobacterium sp. MMLR14_006]